MPPLLSSESPCRVRSQSIGLDEKRIDEKLVASSRSSSNRNRRAQTVEAAGASYLHPAAQKSRKSHLQTQLVSFDLESSLDDLALGSPPTRTASAPPNQFKQTPRRHRAQAIKISAPSRDSQSRRRGAGSKSKDSALQNEKNRRRPRSKHLRKAGGDTSESSGGGAKTKLTQDDLNGLVIGGVGMH